MKRNSFLWESSWRSLISQVQCRLPELLGHFLPLDKFCLCQWGSVAGWQKSVPLRSREALLPSPMVCPAHHPCPLLRGLCCGQIQQPYGSFTDIIHKSYDTLVGWCHSSWLVSLAVSSDSMRGITIKMLQWRFWPLMEMPVSWALQGLGKSPQGPHNCWCCFRLFAASSQGLIFGESFFFLLWQVHVPQVSNIYDKSAAPLLLLLLIITASRRPGHAPSHQSGTCCANREFYGHSTELHQCRKAGYSTSGLQAKSSSCDLSGKQWQF